MSPQDKPERRFIRRLRGIFQPSTRTCETTPPSINIRKLGTDTGAESIAADWEAVRPLPRSGATSLAHQAALLERKLQSLEPASRLAYLVNLGIYAVTHDIGHESLEFLNPELLDALEKHTSPPVSEVERSSMSTFTWHADMAHPYTRTKRAEQDGSIIDPMEVYEGQLRDLATHPGAKFLGFVYLQNERAQGRTPTFGKYGELDDAPIRETVQRYAHLCYTSALQQ